MSGYTHIHICVELNKKKTKKKPIAAAEDAIFIHYYKYDYIHNM